MKVNFITDILVSFLSPLKVESFLKQNIELMELYHHHLLLPSLHSPLLSFKCPSTEVNPAHGKYPIPQTSSLPGFIKVNN